MHLLFFTYKSNPAVADWLIVYFLRFFYYCSFWRKKWEETFIVSTVSKSSASITRSLLGVKDVQNSGRGADSVWGQALEWVLFLLLFANSRRCRQYHRTPFSFSSFPLRSKLAARSSCCFDSVDSPVLQLAILYRSIYPPSFDCPKTAAGYIVRSLKTGLEKQ